MIYSQYQHPPLQKTLKLKYSSKKVVFYSQIHGTSEKAWHDRNHIHSSSYGPLIKHNTLTLFTVRNTQVDKHGNLQNDTVNRIYLYIRVFSLQNSNASYIYLYIYHRERLSPHFAPISPLVSQYFVKWNLQLGQFIVDGGLFGCAGLNALITVNC